MIDGIRCIILNASYEPLSVVPSKRGLILVIEGKAIIDEVHPTLEVRSVHRSWPLPTQIVLKEYRKARPASRVPAQLTQRNLFIRDKYKCQYCGREKRQLKNDEFLTRDHIHASTNGGRDVWTNVVAACNSCNNRKADYTLEEAKLYFNMELLSEPRTPTVFEIWARARVNYPKVVN